MKLNFEQIKSITEGAVKITEENGTYKFFRFTEAQANTYEGGAYNNSFSTAGVKLRFKTDSEKLFLKVNTLKGSSKRYFAFDVSVNGELKGSIKNYDFKSLPKDYIAVEFALGEFSNEFELEKGEKTVQIDFPWSVIGELLEISLDDGANFEPVKSSKKLLVYGDSITQGYDALNPSNRYIAKLAKALDAEEINKAIGGQMFYPELAKEKDGFEPDYITVAYGTNDWNKKPDREIFISEAKDFYRILSNNYPNAKIFAMAPIWRKDKDQQKPFGAFEDIEKVIREVTKDLKNVTVINCFDFVPKEEKYFSDLRLHPNDEGFDYYAKALISAVQAELS